MVAMLNFLSQNDHRVYEMIETSIYLFIPFCTTLKNANHIQNNKLQYKEKQIENEKKQKVIVNVSS